MDPERWQRIEALYHAALACDPDARPALLAGADGEIRREVEKLLAQESVDGVLDSPASEAARKLGLISITPGTQLGPYRIEARAGAGGVGEVFRATDTRLHRTVAIKILARGEVADAAHRQRFQHEARAVSALNHPHICALYDIGSQDGIDFLVLEWLEGETLEARLRKGPLAAAQFFEYAAQVAEALDQAHQRGLIHRDLKPANIMLTKSGAKLLDFGLAKTVHAAAGAADASTMTSLTGEGTIMGTFQYMAPEQLQGKEADARTDIFALGAVLYEMACGRKAFSGENQAALISSIMTADPPPLETAPDRLGALPPGVDRVIHTCLAKKPADRWQNVHDLLLELRWAAQPPAIAAAAGSRGKPYWLLAAVLCFLILAALGLVSIFHPRPEPARSVRFTIPLLPKPKLFITNLFDTAAVSPDGRRVVFTGADAGQGMLFYRPLDALAAQPLSGTEGAGAPFWSPDNRWVAFGADRKLKKIDVTGGPPQEICDLPNAEEASGIGTTGSWGRDGTILFTSLPVRRVYRVPAAGGQPHAVLDLDLARQEYAQFWPQFLPDGRHFAYYSASMDSAKSGIRLGELGSRQTHDLVSASRHVDFAEPGWLFFEGQQSVLVQPFDFGKSNLAGDPVPIANLDPEPWPSWLRTRGPSRHDSPSPARGRWYT